LRRGRVALHRVEALRRPGIRYNRAVAGPAEHELLTLAERCARAAASELMNRYGGSVAGLRAKTTPTDLVSEADLAAERAIRELLARERPGDAILGEEGGASGTGELRWVVDPLDGTINYLFEFPQFAVSVACQDAAGALAGVVLDPVRDECFTATRSGPAKLDGVPFAAPLRGGMPEALVGTGFAYDAAVRARQAEVLARVLPRVRDVRRAGSAALDLVWCACGRLDGYWERGLKPWDRAAGVLIAQRAGLAVRELEPRDGLPDGVLVGPERWVDELYGLVA
jgi:myo-inositol-1(or 4)-monophosphatase